MNVYVVKKKQMLFCRVFPGNVVCVPYIRIKVKKRGAGNVVFGYTGVSPPPPFVSHTKFGKERKPRADPQHLLSVAAQKYEKQKIKRDIQTREGTPVLVSYFLLFLHMFSVHIFQA